MQRNGVKLRLGQTSGTNEDIAHLYLLTDAVSCKRCKATNEEGHVCHC